MSLRRMFGAAGLLLVGAVMAACAPSASGAVPIPVTLHDDGIEFDGRQVPSGRIAFEISNEGALVHEVEVFSGAAEGQILPVRSSVADTTGLTLVDEVENILVEFDASLVVNLSPGTYLVICNMPAHYQNGMWAFMTVEDATG